MSACATGCGVACPDILMCDVCWAAWIASGEFKRADAMDCEENPIRLAARFDVAQADFCNRVRAERTVRNNEVPSAE